MRKCNICKQHRPDFWYKSKRKKTCRSCERSLFGWFLRNLVKQRQLTPAERLGNRLGYMGSIYNDVSLSFTI